MFEQVVVTWCLVFEKYVSNGPLFLKALGLSKGPHSNSQKSYARQDFRMDYVPFIFCWKRLWPVESDLKGRAQANGADARSDGVIFTRQRPRRRFWGSCCQTRNIVNEFLAQECQYTYLQIYTYTHGKLHLRLQRWRICTSIDMHITELPQTNELFLRTPMGMPCRIGSPT